KEPKLMGEKLIHRILKAINSVLDHTGFSFIPNSAEVAFYGMLEGLENYLNEEKVQLIAALGHNPDMEEL
ncbi:amidophosphoribosyltransferase, partial [Bacteroides nordii]|nr:amidophosphoribosyltransferase [Bacteroides nordii]